MRCTHHSYQEKCMKLNVILLSGFALNNVYADESAFKSEAKSQTVAAADEASLNSQSE